MGLKNVKTECSGVNWTDLISLINQLKNDQEYKFLLLICIGSYFGLRIGDILKLSWSDLINKDEIEISESKTCKSRRIVINPFIRDVINLCFENFKKKNQNPDAINKYIFENRKGFPMSRQYINRKLHSIFYANNIKVLNGSSHTLRKTFGKRVYEMSNKTEASLVLLSEIYRHSSIDITRRYIGIVSNDIKNVYLSL